MKHSIPKLAADGSNWVIYRDRLLWVLDTNSLNDHLTHDSTPMSYASAGGLGPDERWRKEEGVRLKLAFCMTCAVRVLVLAQGPSFLRLRRALLGQRGDSQGKRNATVTSGGVETIQRSCSTSTEEAEVVWKW